MKRRFAFGLFCISASSVLLGGVGVWTSSPRAGVGVVLAPDGALYVGCGAVACKSTNHGSSWQSLSGPGGGPLIQVTRVLAVDAAGSIYATVYSGGGGNLNATLYVSRDGGGTWMLLRGPDQGTTFMSLTLDPFSGGLILFEGWGDGLGGGFNKIGGYGGLFRSTDGGMNWSGIGQGMNAAVSAFAFDPRASGHLYAAAAEVSLFPPRVTAPVFFTSSDGGSTWDGPVSNLPGPFLSLVLDPTDASTIVGGGPAGIFQSHDGGQTFSSRSASAVTQIVADPSRAHRLYAAAPPNGVLASLDGGSTWAPLNAGLTDLMVDEVAVSPADGFLYALTPSGTFVNILPEPGALDLNASHPFVVTLTATDQRTGRTGPGVATQVNDLWGYFSIPAITGNPNNPEVFVKMLDGTAMNGSYWFFYGGLTDLEYTLTVTEDANGRQKTYTKPAGSECGGSDTAAFTP